jgi:16S rRNA (guanine527-N7)-methyltransferase
MSSLIGDILERETKTLGMVISSQERNCFELYAAELLKWNSKVNLTSITKDAEIAVKHFIDSLSIAQFLSAGDRLLDIGSGAGLPIIPLKIVRPETEMVSVDAVAKKIHFQRHVIRLLRLQHIEALHARIEALHKTHRHSFTVITSRAFTQLDRFVTLAAPLLAKNGTLIAMQGDYFENEIMAASSQRAHEDGFTVTAVHHYSLPMGMGKRALTFLKTAESSI